MSQLYIPVLFAIVPVAPTCGAVQLYICIASASHLSVDCTWRVAAITHFVLKEADHAEAGHVSLSNQHQQNLNTEAIVQDAKFNILLLSFPLLTPLLLSWLCLP